MNAAVDFAPTATSYTESAALPAVHHSCEASVMSDTPTLKGPASYFPSIEKTYGQPVGHWLALLVAQGGLKHMELVAFLKTEHGLGHGHANALVAHHLSAARAG
jgi:hypothetical protein